MAARLKSALFRALVVLAFVTLPACAQQPAQSAQPDWYVQKKCPETADCMPGPDNARAERCAWIKANCPNTKIAY
jgi:hypothetical protein